MDSANNSPPIELGPSRGFVWGHRADQLAQALRRRFGGAITGATELQPHLDEVGFGLDTTTAHRAWRALAMTACIESTQKLPGGLSDHAIGLACSLHESLADNRPQAAQGSLSGSTMQLQIALQHPCFTSQACYTLRASSVAKANADLNGWPELERHCLEAVRFEWDLAQGRLGGHVGLGQSCPWPRNDSHFVQPPAALQRLLFEGAQLAVLDASGADHHVSVHANQINPSEFPDAAILPGAFDPLHQGHLRMAEVGAQLLGKPVHFELSVRNVDKPTLDYLELARRCDQFEESTASGAKLCVTRAATFAEKATLFPRSTFLVGVDTILRIADPKYYASPTVQQAAMEQIHRRGCRFLVFGRKVGGDFQRPSDADLPAALHSLCRWVSEREFRHDISSTELRLKSAEEKEADG